MSCGICYGSIFDVSSTSVRMSHIAKRRMVGVTSYDKYSFKRCSEEVSISLGRPVRPEKATTKGVEAFSTCIQACFYPCENTPSCCNVTSTDAETNSSDCEN